LCGVVLGESCPRRRPAARRRNGRDDDSRVAVIMPLIIPQRAHPIRSVLTSSRVQKLNLLRTCSIVCCGAQVQTLNETTRVCSRKYSRKTLRFCVSKCVNYQKPGRAAFVDSNV